MSEEEVFFSIGEIKIEGLLEDLPGDRGIVIAHPHPLYGGEMNNNVVDAVRRAFNDSAYSTLRFNFRGVGRSGGSHDNGVGEQEDVRAALTFLSNLGKNRIMLAGYSFGAWVCALGIETFDQAEQLIMISPPVRSVDFTFLKNNAKIALVIAGSDDEIGDVQEIEKMLSNWNPEAVFEIIEGADHFYWGKTDAIQAVLREFLKDR